jgi:thioredoxin reductase (NADPH)
MGDFGRDDVAVVGAGPVGLACAIECKRRGLSARVFDRGAVVNSLLGYPTNMEFFSTPDLLEIGGHPFPTLRYKPLREEAIDYYSRVAFAEELDLALYEEVRAVKGDRGRFVVETAMGRHHAGAVIVSTGFFDRPTLMGVPGEDLRKVTHYYKEPFAYAGQDVLVVGAKNSAARTALDCYRHGARVTLAVRGLTISDSVKYWIKPDLENRISEGSITAFFETEVVRIEAYDVTLRGPSGPFTIANDWVLAMTGYEPDFTFLERLGVDTLDDAWRTPSYDPDTFETNRPGVYIAGTVCGGLNTSRWFIENGRDHAHRIARHIASLAEEASKD